MLELLYLMFIVVLFGALLYSTIEDIVRYFRNKKTNTTFNVYCDALINESLVDTIIRTVK